jgi:hypothetical protein
MPSIPYVPSPSIGKILAAGKVLADEPFGLENRAAHIKRMLKSSEYGVRMPNLQKPN